jgi:hypothetical protein
MAQIFFFFFLQTNLKKVDLDVSLGNHLVRVLQLEKHLEATTKNAATYFLPNYT